MKVFTCNDHAGHWVGAASVVVAVNKDEAHILLEAALMKAGLYKTNFTLTELDLTKKQAIILQDGDY